MGEHATIPPDRGIFLDRTYRLHPDICAYISEEFYESRLEPDPVTHGRSTPLGTGLRFVPVTHVNRRQESPEEVEVVAAEVGRLLASGVEPAEIMVVAAYNAQVNALREVLPASVRAGTVDKFQGQEADVVLYSMASSTGEDIPRGLEFLLSRNRINVAISRARCLAYLVASPRLLEVNCRTIEQMRLANALCRFVELADAAVRTDATIRAAAEPALEALEADTLELAGRRMRREPREQPAEIAARRSVPALRRSSARDDEVCALQTDRVMRRAEEQAFDDALEPHVWRSLLGQIGEEASQACVFLPKS